MSTVKATATRTTIEAMFDGVLTTAKGKIAKKEVGDTDRDLLIKKINAEKKVFEVQRDLLLDAVTDDLTRMQIKNHTKEQILTIDEKYRSEMEAFNIYTTEVAEVTSEVLIIKLVKPVKPIFRGLARAVDTLKKELLNK